MSLRKGIIIFVCITLTAQLAALLAVSLLVQGIRTERLEQQVFGQFAFRVRQALANDIISLQKETRDYFEWDDTLAYVKDPDPAFEEANFSHDSLDNLGLDLSAILNDSGTPVMLVNVDHKTNESHAFPGSVLSLIRRASARMPEGPHPHVSGIARVADGILLYSVRPITKSDGTGERSGVGFMGRWLDDELVRSYEPLTGVKLRVAGDMLPDDTGGLAALGFGTDDTTPQASLNEIDQKRMELVITVLDDEGEVACQLVGLKERLIHDYGLASNRLYVLICMVLGIGSALLLLRELNKRVLRRILNLGGQIRQIEEDITSTRQIEDQDDDELGRLGSDFNALLAKLRASQAQIADKESQLRLLLERSPLAITIADSDGRLILVNERYRSLTGYGMEDLKTLDHLQELLIPDPDYRRTVIEKFRENSKLSAVKGAVPKPVEYSVRTRFGTDLEVETFMESAGGLIFRVANDVTQRDRSLRELIAASEAAQAASEAAQSASEAKSRFLANMSHEIRTPLNGIVGMTQILREQDMGPVQSECLEIISESCDLLVSVINDVLDISKIESGKFAILPSAVSPRDIVASVNAANRNALHAKGLSFRCEVASSVPALVFCDGSRLRQVLLNLLANAAKFTDKGGVSLLVDSPEGVTDTLRFRVSDSGIGISLDDVGHLFTPFFQVDNSLTRNYGGTGLGLAICNKLVGLMGGSISVESEPGKGSTFTFTVKAPAMREPEFDADTSQTRIDPTMATRMPMRILLVEDNSVNRTVAGMMLERMGYRISHAKDGAEAVAMAADAAYDLILMDVQMPVMDGLEASRKILAAGRDKPPYIVALTAHALEEDARKCAAAGMRAYLTKPLKVGTLQSAIEKAWKAIGNAQA